MEENMKVYTPKKQLLDQRVREVKDTKKVIRHFKNQSRLDTLMEVFNDCEKREKAIAERFPCVNLFYNWLIGIIVIALFVSFGIWGMQISTDRKAAALAATAMAEYQADQNALEQERLRAVVAQQQSEEHIVDEMANALAKVFYGVKNFEEKYRYQESDFETLARCVFNRVENKTFAVAQKAEAVANGEIELDENGKPLDERDYIYAIISHEDQWVGYYSNNPVLDKYQKLAAKFIKAWRAEETKPISNDYLWAEFTPNGIFLKNDYHAGAYAHRYHA